MKNPYTTRMGGYLGLDCTLAFLQAQALSANYVLVHFEAFHLLLENYYRGQKGYDMVLNNDYMIEDDTTMEVLKTCRPLKTYLRRGMKFNMIMIFGIVETPKFCLRCGSKLPEWRQLMTTEQ